MHKTAVKLFLLSQHQIHINRTFFLVAGYKPVSNLIPFIITKGHVRIGISDLRSKITEQPVGCFNRILLQVYIYYVLVVIDINAVFHDLFPVRQKKIHFLGKTLIDLKANLRQIFIHYTEHMLLLSFHTSHHMRSEELLPYSLIDFFIRDPGMDLPEFIKIRNKQPDYGRVKLRPAVLNDLVICFLNGPALLIGSGSRQCIKDVAN